MKFMVGKRRCVWALSRGRQCSREGRYWYADGRWLCSQHFAQALKLEGETYERYVPPVE